MYLPYSDKRKRKRLEFEEMTMNDFEDCRMTPGPNVLISVIDSIKKFYECSIGSAKKKIDEFSLEMHRFPGSRQHPTPVATFTELQTILSKVSDKHTKRMMMSTPRESGIINIPRPKSNVDEWKILPVHTMYMIYVCKIDQLVGLSESLPIRRYSALKLWDNVSDKSIIKIGYTGNWPARLNNYRNHELKNTIVSDV